MMNLLTPLSWPYAAVMDVRNWMFTHGWLRERSFEVPTICIGNLAVGGTGKTPHAEWLVQHLLDEGHRVATLSRGYGRKSRGYHEASTTSTATEVGDEPLQMYRSFEGKVPVSVCEDRCRGIQLLTKQHPDVDVIVLDDAFQHRYVRPKVRILLSEFNAPYFQDRVLPAGRLREPRRGANRADIIIITKCPDTLTSEQQRDFVTQIAPQAHQHVFFSKMEYARLPELEARPGAAIALLAGIAHPEPFKAHFEQTRHNVVRSLFYPDHHNFTSSEIKSINALADEADYIITTAKDFARLRSLPLSPTTLEKIKVQHIIVRILEGEENTLYSIIKSLIQ